MLCDFMAKKFISANPVYPVENAVFQSFLQNNQKIAIFIVYIWGVGNAFINRRLDSVTRVRILNYLFFDSK